MHLFRAMANKLHRLDGTGDVQPEVYVFFECPAADAGTAAAQLIRLLELAWGCPKSEVDFCNLFSEADLLAMSQCPADAGDARLLECGHYLDPIFCDPQRTLLICRPTTVQRLLAAQRVVAAHARWAEQRRQLGQLINRQNQAAPGLARRASDVRSA